jgi:hypothetical protein
MRSLVFFFFFENKTLLKVSSEILREKSNKISFILSEIEIICQVVSILFD